MKNISRKIISTTLLILLLTSAFTGCSKKSSASNEGSKKLNVTATFYPLYIMLLNITEGIPDIQVNLLAPSDTGCLHDYQLTTKDMKAITDCDVLVANGAGMEDFLEKAIEQKKDRTIVASEGFELYEENSHIWVSPEGAVWEIKKICEGLEKIIPENKAALKTNSDAYIKKINDKSKKMHESLEQYKNSKIITFHEAFPYFAQEFSFDTVSVIERDAGTQPTAKEMNELINLIKENQSKGIQITLFAEPQYPSEAADIISTETGLSVYILDPAVTGKLEKNSYLDAMDFNLSSLEKAFRGK